MGVLDMGRDVNTPSLKQQKLTGFVVENDDPKKLQRVKIRVPQLHRGIPDEDLPWILAQADGGSTSNGGSGMGRVNVPPINTKLYVHMEAEDPHNLYYGGSPTTQDVNDGHELLDEDYPNTYGYTDMAGNKVSTNTAQKTITTQHVSGTTVHIGTGGEVTIYGAQDVSIIAEGKLTAFGRGGTVIGTQESTTDILGSKINLNGDHAGFTNASIPKRTKPELTNRVGKPEA